MNRVGLAVAFAALGLACGSVEGGPVYPELGPPTLTPDAELADETAAAVEAWAAATGIAIVLGSGGTPVRLSDDIPHCGETLTARRALDGALAEIQSIEIRSAAPDGLYCRPRSGTLRHELGHVIQQYAQALTWPVDDGHAADGLLAPRANASYVIDEPALEKVCSVADCAWMAVEAP